MARRERRQPEPGEFVDPLSNYNPPEIADAVARSITEDTIEIVPFDDHLKARQDMTVHEAVKLMNDNHFACVVVMDDARKPVGIFSERDVLNRVSDNYDAVRNKLLREVMTPNPVTVHKTDSPAKVLNVMVSGGFRHVPVVDEDGRIEGMVGVRKITSYLQAKFPKA